MVKLEELSLTDEDLSSILESRTSTKTTPKLKSNKYTKAIIPVLDLLDFGLGLESLVGLGF